MNNRKKRIYSGVCVCGHEWTRHHLSMTNSEYYAATGESEFPGECLFYGCNETGGMKKVKGKWVDHCHGYLDKDDPDRRSERLEEKK